MTSNPTVKTISLETVLENALMTIATLAAGTWLVYIIYGAVSYLFGAR